MDYKIEKGSDGWKIEDAEGNYLTYIEHFKVAETCYGVVDGKTVSQGNLRKNWKRSGRGRISDATWKKIIAMDDYFFKNY